MDELDARSIDCPCCGERIELAVDCSVEQQEYVEDCSVCCRPIVVTVVAEAGELLSVEVRAEGG